MKRTGALTWVEIGADPKQNHETQMAEPQAWGDVVLARKETPTSYHLSVVVDDALQGVTRVVRGQDLLRTTSIHRLLQMLLDLPAPIYHHHRLILDCDGRKLSKSSSATGLRMLLEGGARGWAAAIKSTAGQLAMLTALIVDAVRAEAKGLVLRRTLFEPRQLAEVLAAALAARCGPKGLASVVTMSPDLPHAVVGDPLR